MKPIVPEIFTFVLGSLENNSYLLVDPQSFEGVVIDPSFDSDKLLSDAQERGVELRMVLLTHAHFDHIAGVRQCSESGFPPPRVALHPADFELYRQGGGAAQFGIPLEAAPAPQVLLQNGQVLHIGNIELIVYHTPGHTRGHVIFYCPAAEAAFCGDLIFAGSVGRTDLPGGDYDQLIASIRSTILVLPPETRLLSGHGPETTVAEEIVSNPFLTSL
jgi:glyoxylase-like metal-dependent hydrolase (beta-lactamase superfamily II)